MNEFRQLVNEIVNSNKTLKERERELYELGLTKSDVSQLLCKELIAIERERQAKRLEKRVLGVNKRIAMDAGKRNLSGQMKCLAIRQPWASLIVAGIKDVELRDNMIPPCSRFLVAASSTRAAKTLDEVLHEEVLSTVNDYINNRVLPPYCEWPTGAIIGYVDIDRVTYDEIESPWATGHDGIKYVLKNAYMFDTPIYGKNKATPFFYNVDGIDEDHLPPSHVVIK